MQASNPETHAVATDAIDESRRTLIDAIGPTPEMTLIRPFGNFGDELIWEGTRRLLSGHVYREIGIDHVAAASGELAVISGGGAWSRRFNEVMPEALAIAELRFERVIVLPSTFEVTEDRVRAALESSKALVFAREQESFDQIRGICRARIAHDCAFFADFSDYSAPGEGELNAFRVDGERLGERPIPSGNDDISDTADSLEHWLRTIEQHEVVNTDRAHVMIAAAMMGKRVNYSPSSYFKVEAIAEYALGGYDVHALPAPDAQPGTPEPATQNLPLGGARADAPARVTVAVLTRDNDDDAVATIDSALGQSGNPRVLVLDRNSRPRTRAALREVSARAPEVDFRFANRDSGIATNLRLATELADSEYVMFLGDQHRLEPGALEQLVDVLDADPNASAVTPAVVATDGSVLSCGGWPQLAASTVGFEITREGEAGATGWVPSQASLFRRSVLDQLPFAVELDLECQNADWCLRVEEFAPGTLRRCPDARVVGAPAPSGVRGTNLVSRANAVRSLPSHARFLEIHGRLLAEPLLELIPELRDPDGSVNVHAATILLGLVTAHGTNWTLMEWMNGGLDILLAGRPTGEEPEFSEEKLERVAWLEERNEILIGIENGGWWQLRNRLRKVVGK